MRIHFKKAPVFRLEDWMKGLNAEEISTFIYLSAFSDTVILWCITQMLFTEREWHCNQWSETESNSACQQQKTSALQKNF